MGVEIYELTKKNIPNPEKNDVQTATEPEQNVQSIQLLVEASTRNLKQENYRLKGENKALTELNDDQNKSHRSSCLKSSGKISSLEDELAEKDSEITKKDNKIKEMGDLLSKANSRNFMLESQINALNDVKTSKDAIVNVLSELLETHGSKK